MRRTLALIVVLVAGGFLLPVVVPWFSEQTLGIGCEVSEDERIEGQLRRGVARYNRQLASRATVELTPQEVRISGRTVTMPYLVNSMIAPGSRNAMAAQLRRVALNSVCGPFRFAVRHGWRFAITFSDVAGAQIRVTVGPQDC